MKRKLQWLHIVFLMFSCIMQCSKGQSENEPSPALPPSALESCNGIFVSYEFNSRTKELPHLKNASAQSWAFNATATVINAGVDELDAWKLFVGFQHREILVSATGGVLADGSDFPADVGNGTYFSGSSPADLETSIDTAGDLNQIRARIEIIGTQFGVKPPAIPMPKTIKLVNDGYRCPAPTHRKSMMYACCPRDPKFKIQKTKEKRMPRKHGHLTIAYDVLQAYENNYLTQVTIDNNHPLGRLDHWNLTWEWMRGEFIYSMKGAYTLELDTKDCIFGPPGKYFKDMDFSKVMNCQKHPVITDLPKEKANDTDVGKIPYCCRNGSLLSVVMDPSQSRSIFQMQVFKPPPTNITEIYPPEKWKISGVHSPTYQCGLPSKVDPVKFPDPAGTRAIKPAIGSWQIVCNMTSPKKGKTNCCVSFSAYFNESAVPCCTCACGCNNTTKCNPNAPAMLLTPEALLVPFENRISKAKAWAKIQHFHIPKPLPCGDNCGVSINWHIDSDFIGGWTARVTIFNWEKINFEDWFIAVETKAFRGFETAYSFNGTLVKGLNDTILLQGLPGMNFLVGEKNGTKGPRTPKVPGKQQSVLSFSKVKTPGIRISEGDGFPTKVLFNGEECALPTRFPRGNGHRYHVNLVLGVLVICLTVMMNHI